MKTYICLLPDEDSLSIEAEPLSTLEIYLTDEPSLRELQCYAQAYGVEWVAASKGQHCLHLPCGTLHQRMDEGDHEREEMYLVHLPDGGLLEHRRVLHPSIAPDHPQAEAWKVSTLSLFRQLW